MFEADEKIRERRQSRKKQTRYTYLNGPMYYLGQQIVRAMQDAGYPAVIHTCYRPPEEQQRVYDKGHSKALPFDSAHQYLEATDIVHPELFWNASPEYWDTLATCVEVVAEKFDVPLEHGHHWSWVDSAHVELVGWRAVRDRLGKRSPTEHELWGRFEEVLPKVAKQAMKSASFPSELRAVSTLR